MFYRRYKTVLLIILMSNFIFSLTSCALQIPVVPRPKQIVLKDFNLVLDNSWFIIVNKGSSKDVFTARELQRYLQEKFGLLLLINNGILASTSKKIIIANPIKEKNVGQIFAKGKLLPGDKLDNEGYLLEIYPDDLILVSANSSEGLFYGMQTLKQLVFSEGKSIKVKACKIEDWPICRMRCAHIQTVHVENLHELKEFVRQIAPLKINSMIIDSEWWYKKEKYPELLKFVRFSRRYYVEPIPEMQSFGVAKPILVKDPFTAEAVWVRDEKFKFINDFAVPRTSENIVIKNPSFEEINNFGQKLKSWSLSRTGKGGKTWLIEDKGVYSGKYCVKIFASEYSDTLFQVCKNITPDTAYSLSFYAKKNEGSSDGYAIAVRVSQWDSGGNFIVENFLPVSKTSVNKWKKYILNFLTQSDCSSIHISINIVNGHGVAWFDDIFLRRFNGKLINVIRTKVSDIVVTSLDKKKKYIEGEDYEVLNGEINYPYDLDVVPTIIRRIKDGRIVDNEEVLISYDFVLRLYHSLRKISSTPSEPGTYEILFAALSDVIKTFRPRFIHIGHDEIYGMNRDSRSKRRNLSNAELLSEDIIKIYNYIKTEDSKIKILMWDDMINPWHYGGRENFQVLFGGQKGRTSDAINLIPKEIIPVVWWYDSNDSFGKMKNSPSYYADSGFLYLVAGWRNEDNIKEWIKIVDKNKNAIGIIITNWLGWKRNFENIRIGAIEGWSGKN